MLSFCRVVTGLLAVPGEISETLHLQSCKWKRMTEASQRTSNSSGSEGHDLAQRGWAFAHILPLEESNAVMDS